GSGRRIRGARLLHTRPRCVRRRRGGESTPARPRRSVAGWARAAATGPAAPPSRERPAPGVAPPAPDRARGRSASWDCAGSGCEVRPGPCIGSGVGTALAALGGGGKLAAPQAEQVLQLAVQAAEPLQIAGGEGRVGLRRELLCQSPPRGQGGVGRRACLATRG